MLHPKKPSSSSTMNISPHEHERPMSTCVQGDSGLVLTTDPKPRLRWTVELHERFVDAVAQLGGPDKATPKTIMRAMGVKGLTLYHLKSHLQKFRLGKQPHKDFNDHHHTMKDGHSERVSAFELHRNINASSSGMTGRSMNEMQMEVNRRLHEQLEVQRHLQLRIEAHGKYMQTILERACQTLSSDSIILPETSSFKDSGPSSVNFPSLQDLHIYGPTSHDHHHQQLELHHHNMGRSSSMDSFMRTSNNNDNISNKNNDSFFMTKKRQNDQYNNNSVNRSVGKSPLIWDDDFRFRESGTATSSCLDDTQIQIGPLSMDN